MIKFLEFAVEWVLHLIIVVFGLVLFVAGLMVVGSIEQFAWALARAIPK